MNRYSGLQINCYFAQGCLENLWGLMQIKNVGPLYITDKANLQALTCELSYYIDK